MSPLTTSYGSWRSPVTSELISSATLKLSEVKFHDQWVYWIETRATEEGRNVIVRATHDGRWEDVLPAPFHARTRVHEYGGGSYTVGELGIFFSHDSDQRIYRITPGSAPTCLTPAGSYRYADFIVDKSRERLIGVLEDHSGSGEPTNHLFLLPVAGGQPARLTTGRDFYASPRLSHDGRYLAWLEWSHPEMPWDSAELWMAELGPDGLRNRRHIAGGKGEAVFQPSFSPTGLLHFISDRSGWSNLYAWDNGTVTPLTKMTEEVGAPLWVFGLSTYDFTSDGIALRFGTADGHRLAILRDGTLGEPRFEGSDISYVKASGNHLAFIAGTPSSASALWWLSPNSAPVCVRASTAVQVPADYLSIARSLEFPTTGNRKAFAHYYAPHNAKHIAPADERPPCIVTCHGGPTAHSTATLNLGIQFWTSRGFAVIDVNYGGSTGYGRAYRERLRGAWGIVDVDDCAAAAEFLVSEGKADKRRLAIRGGSAGGYTTLAALTFRDTFRAGASYYGVSDLKALLQDTHKFESHYDRFLIGEFDEELYRQRSPLFHLQQLNAPIIFLQGLEDRVVPPNQAERMVEALRAKGLPVAYVAFPGEQHGFRKSANIRRALDAELYFYSKVFGFPLAEEVPPVEIFNL